MGAVRYVDGVHLSKKSPSGKGALPALFVERGVIDITLQGPTSEEGCDSLNEGTAMQSDATEAEWKFVAEGGCALFSLWACILAELAGIFWPLKTSRACLVGRYYDGKI